MHPTLFSSYFVRSLLLSSLAALALAGCALDSTKPEPLAGLDSWVEQGRQDWQLPGLAVAVVYRDAVIYARGFGTLGLESELPVNEHTLFGVASTSKAMTATALGLLVDEGKLSWDDKVIDHLPYFQLADPWVTQEVRIRDLLTHRVGLGRITGNRIQFMPTASREQVIRQMQHHDFEQPFRAGFVYNNVMYSVAGEVVAAVSGQSWDEFVRERLFAPLGMQRSNTSITQFAADDANIALPHQFINGEIVPIARRNFDNVGPSASVNSSVYEMAQWLRLNLGEPGVYQGQRLLSEEVMAEIFTPQVVVGRASQLDPVRAYGLGWYLEDYRGYATASHGGATDGFNTQVTLVPELELGIIVVGNTFENFRPAVTRTIIDRIAGLPAHDWHSHYLTQYQQDFADASSARQQIEQQRQPDLLASLSPEQITGRYQHPLYGNAEVSLLDNGDLLLQFWDDGLSKLTLEHWQGDTYRAHWHNKAQREKFVHFATSENGAIELSVEWTLRPQLLQVGIYPAPYRRTAVFGKIEP
ncbi:serine hydrolase [Alkalimonas amylolytica]|uniref:CubicO group peptidase, beta-lactamase class C family n=1 Tax=Alkalimonas amylolytica TaxID=152573 RepID=A0A1H4DB19_ALKAM|nr:serine hydrolase [Alkalimonas amylolytica]SEA69965.1 CubicO group peptidase, beta-lactamase class C family [Alkalimonas amylolytica]